ncbi:hypothetical protein CF651_16875 [Paenibacillus rigui]|uniref:Heparinase n=2 Tax=Paenibacillus rigui TaxID=554312 RepID=A0A229UQ66_9BACL|nr:hypothetical protein CF651_16875 [Paenibacillus rigui]
MDRNQIAQMLRDHADGGRSLLFPAGDSAQWWSRIGQAEAYRPVLHEIREVAEALLRLPAPELTYGIFRLFGEKGSRLEYERPYFEMRKRLNTFTLYALLEPEREDVMQALQETIWAICNEYTWCLPAHVGTTPETVGEAAYSLQEPSADLQGNASMIDLFSAETGFALSEILRLTEHRLPLLLRNRIRHEVYRRLFWPYMHQGPFSWETATHNWAAVCAGSIGSAALHLMTDEDDLSAVLEKVLRTMDCYLQGFKADGATTEGYGYWYYGFGFFVFFADLLKKRTGGAMNLFSNERVHRIALFQQKCFMSGASVVNFSDSLPEAHIHMGLTHYLNRMYPDVFVPSYSLRTGYTEDHCSRWATALRNVLWHRPEKAADGQPWGEASYFLEDAQWLVSRHRNEHGIYCFAAKGGHNAEPHNHNDVGHFILHAAGDTFLADLGSGMYTQDYFGDARYSYLCNGSQGHSVPIVNGRVQQEGAQCRAQAAYAAVNRETERLQLDFASAYGMKELKQLTRTFQWHKKEQPVLELEDTFVFNETPDSLIERFMTMLEPDVSGNDLVIPGRERRLIIRYDHERLQPHVQKLEYADHFGVQQDVYAIDFKVLQPEKRCKVQLGFQFE